MKKLLCISMLGLFLTGCGDGMPPNCDSKEVKNSIKKIFTKQLGINPIVTNYKMVQADKENKEYLCSMVATYNSKAKTLNYSVTWQDSDKKLFYVQIAQ